MHHPESVREFAVEGYVIGELSDTERQEFERHLFECPECAEAVETAGVFIANARIVWLEQALHRPRTAVPEERFWSSFFGRGFVPAATLAGCAILAVLVGYQNLVQIPALRAKTPFSDLLMAPGVFVRAARAQQGLTFSRRGGIISVTVAHEWGDTYLRYEAEIERASDHVRIAKTELPGTSADVSVLADLQRAAAGSYILSLYGVRERPAERIPLAQIPLTLTE